MSQVKQSVLYHPYQNLPPSLNLIGLRARILLRDNQSKIKNIIAKEYATDRIIYDENHDPIVLKKTELSIKQSIKQKIKESQIQHQEKSFQNLYLEEKQKVDQAFKAKSIVDNDFYKNHSLPLLHKNRSTPILSSSSTNDTYNSNNADNISKPLLHERKKSFCYLSENHFKIENYPLPLRSGRGMSKKEFLSPIGLKEFKFEQYASKEKDDNKQKETNEDQEDPSFYYSLYHPVNKIVKFGIGNISSMGIKNEKNQIMKNIKEMNKRLILNKKSKNRRKYNTNIQSMNEDYFSQ